MAGERDPWPRGWNGHRSQQEAAWAAATPVERLRWLEEMKRFVAAAERARAGSAESSLESGSRQVASDVRAPGRENLEPDR